MFAELMQNEAQYLQLNETVIFGDLDNLTSWIESDETLTGEDIQHIVQSLEDLLEDFINGMEEGLGDSSDPVKFLQKLTIVVDLTLDAFEGWLDITEVGFPVLNLQFNSLVLCSSNKKKE